MIWSPGGGVDKPLSSRGHESPGLYSEIPDSELFILNPIRL